MGGTNVLVGMVLSAALVGWAANCLAENAARTGSQFEPAPTSGDKYAPPFQPAGIGINPTKPVTPNRDGSGTNADPDEQAELGGTGESGQQPSSGQEGSESGQPPDRPDGNESGRSRECDSTQPVNICGDDMSVGDITARGGAAHRDGLADAQEIHDEADDKLNVNGFLGPAVQSKDKNDAFAIQHHRMP